MRSGSKYRGRRYSGTYSNCVRFEAPVTVEDAGAGRKRNYSPVVGFDAVWCEIVELLEPESFTSLQTKGQVRVAIKCHYFAELQSSWRVVDIASGAIYAVLGIVNHDDREWEIAAIRSEGRS